MGSTWWNEPTAKHVYVLSWISVVVTFACFIGGLVLYKATGSTLCLVFGLENSVDFISSVIVLWRFFVPMALTEAVEKKLEQREERASIAISLILGLLGFGVLVTAMDDFARGEEHLEKAGLILGLSFFTIIVAGTMSLFKFNYSAHLRSSSLFKDGICSLIGTILAGALFVNSIIINIQPGAWWIDPLVSMGCGLAALFLGFHAIYDNMCVKGLPIYSCSWWFHSEGELEAVEKPSVEMSTGHTDETPAEKSDIV